LKLGFEVAERTVSRLMPQRDKQPSQTWGTSPQNHIGQLASVDFFTVSTLKLRMLYVFLILAHDRRRVPHFNVSEHPTAVWLHSKSLKRFRTAMRHGIWFGIAMESMGTASRRELRQWASSRFALQRDVRGRIVLWRTFSAPFAASA
jgi:hypothetical protein